MLKTLSEGLYNFFIPASLSETQTKEPPEPTPPEPTPVYKPLLTPERLGDNARKSVKGEPLKKTRLASNYSPEHSSNMALIDVPLKRSLAVPPQNYQPGPQFSKKNRPSAAQLHNQLESNSKALYIQGPTRRYTDMKHYDDPAYYHTSRPPYLANDKQLEESLMQYVPVLGGALIQKGVRTSEAFGRNRGAAQQALNDMVKWYQRGNGQLLKDDNGGRVVERVMATLKGYVLSNFPGFKSDLPSGFQTVDDYVLHNESMQNMREPRRSAEFWHDISVDKQRQAARKTVRDQQTQQFYDNHGNTGKRNPFKHKVVTINPTPNGAPHPTREYSQYVGQRNAQRERDRVRKYARQDAEKLHKAEWALKQHGMRAVNEGVSQNTASRRQPVERHQRAEQLGWQRAEDLWHRSQPQHEFLSGRRQKDQPYRY